MPAASTLVFSSGPGRVVALPGVGIPLNLTIGEPATKQGGWGGFFTMLAIVTKIGLREGVKAQFTETLQDRIYVYTFGDSLGDIVISGVALSAVCVDGKVPDSGFERVYRYYRNFRLSRTGLPVAISIGASIHLMGFLLGADLLHQDPENGMAQFTLVFKYPPQQDTISLVGAGDGIKGGADEGGAGGGGGGAGGGEDGTGGGEGGFDIIPPGGGNTGGLGGGSELVAVLIGSSSASFAGTVGESGSLTGATFFAADATAPSENFTAVIEWGDGSAIVGVVLGSAGDFHVSGEHTYDVEGSYQITVSVVDSAGNAASINGTAAVFASGSGTAAAPMIGPNNTGFVGAAP